MIWPLIVAVAALAFVLWSFNMDRKEGKPEKVLLYCDDCGEPYFAESGCRRCRGDVKAEEVDAG